MDAALKAINHDVPLPDAPIAVVRRADGSVTTWRLDNSIGYVGYAYAKQKMMSHVLMGNRDGHFVEPPVQAVAALEFFDWAYGQGDKMAAELDYVPMPASVKETIRKRWQTIKGEDGKPVIGL
jgi:phosphate transport system substrate-binding protein